MRVEMPSTRWSKLRTGLHSWTKRSSRVDDLEQHLARWWILVVSGCFFGTKWNGGEKAWLSQLELRDESLRGSHRSGAVNGHDECRKSSTDALSNEAMTGHRKARSVQLYFVQITLCTGRALDRIANAPHGWGTEAWRLLFQCMLQRTMQDLL